MSQPTAEVHERSRRKTRAKKVEYINAIKGEPCADCGGRFHPVAMDFDHVRGTKRLGIAYLVQGTYSLESLIREIAKCEVVCANCHRIRTHVTS